MKLLARRPSAPLVMGVYSGFVAALAVLPVALLLVGWNWNTGMALAGQEAVTAANLRILLDDQGTDVTSIGRLSLAAVVTVRDGRVRVETGSPELAGWMNENMVQHVCADRTRYSLVAWRPDASWAWACSWSGDDKASARLLALTAVEPRMISIRFVAFLLIVLIAVVGLTTAITVQRVLAPLTRISDALTRVSGGERNVRLRATGLAELDELVYRLNQTANAMEQREDAITARIRLVQRMARLVAHEVRNPLQSVELLTSLIEVEDDEQERRETASAIRQEIQGLDQVVSRMLRRSIGDDIELHVRPESISRLLNHVARLHSPQAITKGVTLVISNMPRGEAWFDAALLGRSLENLVVNAMQHARSRIEIGALLGPDTLEIMVEDDGPGVDPTIADRLWEPNISRREGGSGLGLALVRAVVEGHSGRVEHVRSGLGGAAFILTLPREPRSTTASARLDMDHRGSLDR